jgi:hypothetical protein
VKIEGTVHYHLGGDDSEPLSGAMIELGWVDSERWMICSEADTEHQKAHTLLNGSMLTNREKT